MKKRAKMRSVAARGPLFKARQEGILIQESTNHLSLWMPRMHRWLCDMLGSDYDRWIVLRQHEDKTYSLSFWSAEYEYSISFGPKYMGAGYTCRAPNVGEQHRRGCDLYDGVFHQTTWKGIVRDLLRTTLKTVKQDPLPVRKRRVSRSKSKAKDR